MRALVIARPGGPEVLEIRERRDPVPAPREVLVRVRASALNRADLLQRRGLYPAPEGAPPDVPGLEFAGEVAACGDAVSERRCGDRVMGIVGGGAQAELVAVHEQLCLPIPEAMPYEEAAAIPEAYLTAYDALFLRGNLAPGETVLLHAAGSGVGTAAAALATSGGARVVALARSEDKRRRLAAMGLAVVDPAVADPVAAIRGAAGGAIDLVIDLLGAASFAQNVDVLAVLGRMVLLGTMGGASAEVDLGALMRKRLTVIGTVLRSRPLEEKVELTRAFARSALPLFTAGRLRPFVDRIVPWTEARAAHAAMERNENFGKIVLSVA